MGQPELEPGTIVGHANPQLADWRGCISPNAAGDWRMRARAGGDVRVEWCAGTVDGEGREQLAPGTGWTDRRALTVIGRCPVCDAPARYTFAGNSWDQPPGWHHEERD